MSSDWLFQRFIEKTPVTVMVRATLENAFSPQAIDGIFASAARQQYEGELLFSSVVELLTLVVWRQKKSVGEAYKHAEEKFGVSVRSVYNKLNGTETAVCRALVREPAGRLCGTVDALSCRKPLLPGYCTRIIDGNHLTSTDHRLKVLRRTGSGPLPGQALAVLDADRMLITDLFCSEDGEAQERRLFPEVIPAAEPGHLWIADRNFCTTRFLFGLARRGASFLIRRHASTLVWHEETRLKRVGRCKTGLLYVQTLRLLDGDEVLSVRCLTLRLDQPTTSGETEIQLLTNLPVRDAGNVRVAELYLNRWTIENAFQEIEQSLRSEINTLGYPGAALLGFAIAVITYNVLSVAKWAVEAEHEKVIQREQLSGYYLASIVAADYGGMLIALPQDEWTARFAELTPRALARALRACAKHVHPDVFRKNVRGPKRPRPKRSSGRIDHHVSTAELLANQK
jgi:Transposase DDE domain